MSSSRSDAGGVPGTWTVRGIVTTMFPLLLVLSGLEMGSGYVLEVLESTYLDHPTLLVLVPVMIGMGGNLGSILSSRLSTRLHLGLLEFRPDAPDIWINVAGILSLAVTVFTVLGFAAYGVGFLIGPTLSLAALLVISLSSGLMLAVAVIVLSLLTTYVSYHYGLDPDDTTIPVVTNLCDILGVVILSGVAMLVL